MAISPETVTAQAIRLLIIEDEGSQQPLRAFVHALGHAHFQLVAEFSTLSAASPGLDRDFADLLLIALPNGPESCRELAHHPALGTSIPFIIVDDRRREEVEAAAMDIGAQDYLAIEDMTAFDLERAIRWAIRRFRSQRELRRDVELFGTLLNHIPDRVYFKDIESRFIRLSRSVAETHGCDDPALLVGKTDSAFQDPEQEELAIADEQTVMETGIPIIGRITPRALPDGREIWVSSTKLPLQDRRGRVIGIFGISRDVTELKRLELELADEHERLNESHRHLSDALENLQRAHDQLREVQLQLIEAEKLKSIGSLAAGIAHEVKNPLAVISLGVEFLNSRHPDDPDTQMVLSEFNDAISRATNVIRGLLDFAAPRDLDLRACDLNQIIRTALRLVRGEIRKDRHHIDLELAEIPEVEADRGKVCQVFINLLTNALHAMPDGGTLTIRTEARNVESRPCVIATIADSGCGIPPGALEKIFEPFYTTKTEGKGTGLGMSIVRSIMRLVGGTVDMRNRDQGGAEAILTFKISEQS